MFEFVVLSLIQGDFICLQTNPNAYQWLNEEVNQKSVDHYLSKIGRKLVKTNAGNAFYVALNASDSNNRQDVKSVFSHIKYTIFPIINFLDICIKYTREDRAPTAGERVGYSDLLVAVSDNPHALEALRSFTNLGKEFVSLDASPRSMLDKVIQQMIKWGYLIENSKSLNIYMFTGKLDYFYEVLAFIKENDLPTIMDDEDGYASPEKTKQEVLL